MSLNKKATEMCLENGRNNHNANGNRVRVRFLRAAGKTLYYFIKLIAGAVLDGVFALFQNPIGLVGAFFSAILAFFLSPYHPGWDSSITWFLLKAAFFFLAVYAIFKSFSH